MKCCSQPKVSDVGGTRLGECRSCGAGYRLDNFANWQREPKDDLRLEQGALYPPGYGPGAMTSGWGALAELRAMIRKNNSEMAVPRLGYQPIIAKPRPTWRDFPTTSASAIEDLLNANPQDRNVFHRDGNGKTWACFHDGSCEDIT